MTANAPTATEWGFRTTDGRVHPAASRYVAERLVAMRNVNTGELIRPGSVVVSREVTDWTPAEGATE